MAGTKVYEQRRTESLRIMAETDAKRSKINELLDYIETRLEELEEEKEELKEFQDKDKERRCLEYALYQRELEEVTETLAEIEDERKTELHGANIRHERYSVREKEIQVRSPILSVYLKILYSLESREGDIRSKSLSRNNQPIASRYSNRADRLYSIENRIRMSRRGPQGGRSECRRGTRRIRSRATEY